MLRADQCGRGVFQPALAPPGPAAALAALTAASPLPPPCAPQGNGTSSILIYDWKDGTYTWELENNNVADPQGLTMRCAAGRARPGRPWGRRCPVSQLPLPRPPPAHTPACSPPDLRSIFSNLVDQPVLFDLVPDQPWSKDTISYTGSECMWPARQPVALLAAPPLHLCPRCGPLPADARAPRHPARPAPPAQTSPRRS